MTVEQLINEQNSIDAFVDDMTRDVRFGRTNAAVTCVVLSTARAAADMAPRTVTGAIDKDRATEIFKDAVRLIRKSNFK